MKKILFLLLMVMFLTPSVFAQLLPKDNGKTYQNAQYLKKATVSPSTTIPVWNTGKGEWEAVTADSLMTSAVFSSLPTTRNPSKKQFLNKADSSEYQLINDSTYIIKEWRGASEPSTSVTYNAGIQVGGKYISVTYKATEKTVWKNKSISAISGQTVDFILKNNSWKPQKGYLDALDFGFIGDGVTNNQAACNKIYNYYSVTSANNGEIVLFPEGTFLFDSLIIQRGMQLRGKGINTILKGLSSSVSALIVYPQTAANVSVPIRPKHSDFTIQGNVGVAYGNGSQYSESAGGTSWENVVFNTDSIAVLKRFGGIYNKYEKCTFHGGSYGVWAQSANYYNAALGQHTGEDKYNNCRFSGYTKAAYFTKDSMPEAGNTTFTDCAFEGNSGYAAFIKIYSTGIGDAPISFEKCWFEANATSGSAINIEGFNYLPKDIFVRNTKNIMFNACRFFTFNCINSDLKMKDMVLYYTSVTDISVDTLSTVTANNCSGRNNSTPPQIIFQNFNNSISSFVFNTTPFLNRNYRWKKDNLLISNHFTKNDGLSIFGSAASNAFVLDGVLRDTCLETELTSAAIVSQFNFAVTSTSKIYVMTFNYKAPSSLSISEFYITYDVGLGTIPLIKNNKWQSVVVFGKPTSTGGVRFYLPIGTGKIRFCDAQVLEFTNIKDAQEFVNAKTFVTNYTF